MKKALISILHGALSLLGEKAEAAPLSTAPQSAKVHDNRQPVAAGNARIYSVRIITSESRFDTLMTELEKIGITGMTVTRVLGYGMEKGHNGMYSGEAIASRLIPKIECELIVSKIPPETIVALAKKVLYTGRYGDGKIFISSMDNVVKIRTGEEGYDALQDKPL